MTRSEPSPPEPTELGGTPAEEEGRVPSPLDLEWIQHAHTLIRKSPEEIEKSAERIITLSTSIIAFSAIVFNYFGIIGYSIYNISFMVYLLSIVTLLFGILFCFSALSVKTHEISLDDPGEIRASVTRIAKEKNKQLDHGRGAFLLGLAIFSLGLLFFGINFNLGSPIQMEISSEKVPIVEALSVKFINNSNSTEVLSLIKETPDYFLVNNGGKNLIGIKKEYVLGIKLLSPTIPKQISIILLFLLIRTYPISVTLSLLTLYPIFIVIGHF